MYKRTRFLQSSVNGDGYVSGGSSGCARVTFPLRFVPLSALANTKIKKHMGKRYNLCHHLVNFRSFTRDFAETNKIQREKVSHPHTDESPLGCVVV